MRITHVFQVVFFAIIAALSVVSFANPPGSVAATPVVITNQSEILRSQRQQAQPADRFVDSIGVATHLNYLDTPYGEYRRIIKPRLLEVGIRHIRDGSAVEVRNGIAYPDKVVQDRYLDLARHGVKSTLIFGTEPKQVTLSTLKKLLLSVEAVEGPNETDLSQFKYSYKGQQFPKATRMRMKDLYGWVKNDAKTKHISVVQNSLGWGKNAEKLGNLEKYADYGPAHFYTAEANSPGSALDTWHLRYARIVSPNKPLLSTESGYTTAVDDGGISEYAHARYISRILLEHFRKGVVRTHIYELIDEWDKPLDFEQAHFGLLRYNNTPKPAFTLIKNMITVLQDKGTGFKPGVLDCDISGGNSLVHHFVLQKRDGRFYLVIWQDPKNWDIERKEDIRIADQTVTLRLTGDFVAAQTFLSMQNPMPVRHYAHPTTLVMAVPDHPLIVELTPRLSGGASEPAKQGENRH